MCLLDGDRGAGDAKPSVVRWVGTCVMNTVHMCTCIYTVL